MDLSLKLKRYLTRPVALGVCLCFLLNTIAPSLGYAQTLSLPTPGTMVAAGPVSTPALIKGLLTDDKDPFRFEFILAPGTSTPDSSFKSESERLIKYFLAALATPEDELWVNLSPVEKDRIVPEGFGRTAMGRDLLAQDYLLKQITSSLLHPDTDTGKAFWKKVYAAAYEKYGTIDIPVDTFNKVWITPDKATVYTNGNKAYIVDCRMKVLLESDYLSAPKGSSEPEEWTKNILREVVIPALERDVNEGEAFAPLRQVYHSLILAAWFKRKLHESVLNKTYAEKNRNAGLEFTGLNEQEIYQKYLEAYQKGAFNFIREEPSSDGEVVARKYFSGGFTADKAQLDQALRFTTDAAQIDPEEKTQLVQVNLVPPASETDPALPNTELLENSLIENIYQGHPEAIKQLTVFLTKDHPLKKAIFDEVDRMSPEDIIQATNRILKIPASPQKGLLLYDTSLDIRTLTLRATTGSEDVPQSLSTLFSMSTSQGIDFIKKAFGEETAQQGVRSCYLLLKALSLISGDQEALSFQPQDLADENSLLAYYLSGQTVLLTDPENEPAFVNGTDRFLSQGTWLVSRLLAKDEEFPQTVNDMTRVLRNHSGTPGYRSIEIYLELLNILSGTKDRPALRETKKYELAAWAKELAREPKNTETLRRQSIKVNHLLQQAMKDSAQTAAEFDETYKQSPKDSSRGLDVYHKYFDSWLWQPFSADLFKKGAPVQSNSGTPGTMPLSAAIAKLNGVVIYGKEGTAKPYTIDVISVPDGRFAVRVNAAEARDKKAEWDLAGLEKGLFYGDQFGTDRTVGILQISEQHDWINNGKDPAWHIDIIDFTPVKDQGLYSAAMKKIVELIPPGMLLHIDDIIEPVTARALYKDPRTFFETPLGKAFSGSMRLVDVPPASWSFSPAGSWQADLSAVLQKPVKSADQAMSGREELVFNMNRPFSLPNCTIVQGEYPLVEPDSTIFPVITVTLNGEHYKIGGRHYVTVTLPDGKKVYWGGQHNLSYSFFFQHFGKQVQDMVAQKKVNWLHIDEHHDLEQYTNRTIPMPDITNVQAEIIRGYAGAGVTFANYLGYLKASGIIQDLTHVSTGKALAEIPAGSTFRAFDFDVDITVDEPETGSLPKFQAMLPDLVRLAQASDVVFLTNSSELTRYPAGVVLHINFNQAIPFNAALIAAMAEASPKSADRAMTPAERRAWRSEIALKQKALVEFARTLPSFPGINWEKAAYVPWQELIRTTKKQKDPGIEVDKHFGPAANRWQYWSNQMDVRKAWLEMISEALTKGLSQEQLKNKIIRAHSLMMLGESGDSYYFPEHLLSRLVHDPVPPSRQQMEQYASTLNLTDEGFAEYYRTFTLIIELLKSGNTRLASLEQPLFDLHQMMIRPELDEYSTEPYAFLYGNHSFGMMAINTFRRAVGASGMSNGFFDYAFIHSGEPLAFQRFHDLFTEDPSRRHVPAPRPLDRAQANALPKPVLNADGDPFFVRDIEINGLPGRAATPVSDGNKHFDIQPDAFYAAWLSSCIALVIYDKNGAPVDFRHILPNVFRPNAFEQEFKSLLDQDHRFLVIPGAGQTDVQEAFVNDLSGYLKNKAGIPSQNILVFPTLESRKLQETIRNDATNIYDIGSIAVLQGDGTVTLSFLDVMTSRRYGDQEITPVWTSQGRERMLKLLPSKTPFLDAIPSGFLDETISAWSRVNTAQKTSPASRLDATQRLGTEKGFLFTGDSHDFEKAVAAWAGLIDGTEEGEQWRYYARQNEQRLAEKKRLFIWKAREAASYLSENVDWHAAGVGSILLSYDPVKGDGYVAVVDNGSDGFPLNAQGRLDIEIVEGGFLSQKSKTYRGDGVAMGRIIKQGNVIILSHGQEAEIAKRETEPRKIDALDYPGLRADVVKNLPGSAVIVHIPTLSDRAMTGESLKQKLLNAEAIGEDAAFGRIIRVSSIKKTLDPDEESLFIALVEQSQDQERHATPFSLEWQKNNGEERETFLLITPDGKINGELGIIAENNKPVVLHSVWTFPKHEGRGTFMLQNIFQWLNERGIKNAEWISALDSIDFYHKTLSSIVDYETRGQGMFFIAHLDTLNRLSPQALTAQQNYVARAQERTKRVAAVITRMKTTAGTYQIRKEAPEEGALTITATPARWTFSAPTGTYHNLSFDSTDQELREKLIAREAIYKNNVGILEEMPDRTWSELLPPDSIGLKNRSMAPGTDDAAMTDDRPQVSRKFILLNPYHIHTKPSTVLSLLAAKLGNKLGVTIMVKKDGYGESHMTNVMGLLSMFITYSQEIEVSVQGNQSPQVLTKVLDFVERAMQDWHMLEEGTNGNPLYDAYLQEIDRMAGNADAAQSNDTGDSASETRAQRLARTVDPVKDARELKIVQRQFKLWPRRTPGWTDGERRKIPEILKSLHEAGFSLRGGTIQQENGEESIHLIEGITGTPRSAQSLYSESLKVYQDQGGWPAALKAAGLDPDEIQTQPGYTELFALFRDKKPLKWGGPIGPVLKDYQEKESATGRPAPEADAAQTPGGIDMNPSKLDLQETGQTASGLSLPQGANSTLEIPGLIPVILNIRPAGNLRELLGAVR